MKSLIQQRMEITRVRTTSFIYFALAGVILLTGLLQMSSLGNPVVAWYGLLSSVALFAYGLVILARFRRQMREFEREHGVGAGTQTPLA